MLSNKDLVAILQLYERYNQTIDAGDDAGWADTFIETGEFVHPAQTYSGRQRLESFVLARSAKLALTPSSDVRHWNADLKFELVDAVVQGSAMLLVVDSDEGFDMPRVLAVGSYQDTIVLRNERWLFSKRTLTLGSLRSS
ncbi:nuclear transport factor 2 family protein [Achromobacter sp. UMC71]|uniref:nuclear transport factor 2 family protein n=1 Tax=Achromobacter sp. UMC71 TaxID=1862320 RepID=UPI001601E504|nr:nuclear transport factor 2 family protein [Achromobacter sp. UMC71]MBB1628335.1 hypothetical protein [Achromobacter sp. UMC71]